MVDGDHESSLQTRVTLSAVLIVAFLAIGFFAMRGLAMLKKPPSDDASPPPRTAVRVRPAERGSYQERVTGYGRARALRQTRVASELAATVEWISPRLEAGNSVQQGEVLVRLDARNARSALARATANLARANAEVERLEAELVSLTEQLEVARSEFETADRELQRTRTLARQGHATASDVDTRSMAASLRRASVVSLEGRKRTTSAQVTAAEASIAAAEADRTRAANDVGRAEVKAPYAGTIEERLVSPGAYVSPGQDLFGLVDLTRVEVPVALPASRFGEVLAGAEAVVRLRAEDAPVWTGTVARVASVVDPETRTFQAFLLVASESGRAAVPPGAFVLAEIAGARYDGVFVVPRSAFMGGRLFIAGSDTGDVEVESRRPEVRRLLIDVALIEGGLDEGEFIVVTNVEQIADGSRVRVVKEQGTAQ